MTGAADSQGPAPEPRLPPSRFGAIGLLGFGLLSILFVVTRVAFLDSDLPRYSLSQLQPIDEFYYTIPAFNLYHHGSLTHQVVSFIPTDGSPVNLFENFATFLTLSIFGNNYYGLRMASVLAGLAVFVLLYAILRRETIPAVSRAPAAMAQAVPLLWLTYLLFDYSFNLASRVAEGTIFRMVAMVAVLSVASAWRMGKSPSGTRAITFGFLGTVAFLCVYTYNAFLIPGVLLWLTVEGLMSGWRRAVFQLAGGAAGCALAIATFAAVVYATYGQTLLDVYRLDIAPFGARLSTGNLAPALADNLRATFSTNIFRFDFPLLVAFVLALPVFAHHVFKKRSSFGFLVAAMLLLLTLQSEVAPDAPLRRMVMLDPLVVIVLAISMSNLEPFSNALRTSRLGLLITAMYWLVAAAGVYTIFRHEGGALGTSFELLSGLCVAVLVVALAWVYLRRGRMNRFVLAVAMMAVILPGAALSGRELLSGVTYHYRDAMMASAPLLNDQVTAGEYSIAFRLYNSSEPVLNPYQYQYTSSGLATYDQYVQRLVTEGIANRTVAIADSAKLLGLGWRAEATYFVGAEGSPYLVVYVHPGT